MWNVIDRGLELARASVRVLERHPRLLVLPLLSALVVLGPLPLLLSIAKHLGALDPRAHLISFLAIMAPSVFLMSALFMLIQVAFVRSALYALRDEPLDLASALAFSMSRLPSILAWSALSATVGLAFSLLEKITGRVGGWITRAVFGFSWSVATFLFVPVLVQERRGVLPSLRRSNELVTTTLGERFVGEIGLVLISIVPIFVAALPLFVGRHLWHAHLGLALGAIAGGVALVLVVMALMTAVRTLYAVALYQLAVEGVTPREFDAAIGDIEWRTR